MDTHVSRSSNEFNLKYASSDAIHRQLTKKKYAHVQSKVKVYIENIRKQDREKKERIKLTRYRSEPSELSTAQWELFSDDTTKGVSELSSDLTLLLQQKDEEVIKMKNDMETLREMLWNERAESSGLRCKLDVIRLELHHSRRALSDSTLLSTEYSYPKSHFAENRVRMMDVSCETIDNVGDVEDVLSIESDNDTDNDETVLLQASQVTVERKNIKYRLKKILRCCAPCMKDKEH